MRTLVLVRHGQYDSLTGRLTELGRRQAAATVRALQQYEFAAIHCSTLIRAEETANILKKGLRSRLPIQRSRLLCEALPTPVPGLTKHGDLPRLRQDLLCMRRAHARLAQLTGAGLHEQCQAVDSALPRAPELAIALAV